MKRNIVICPHCNSEFEISKSENSYYHKNRDKILKSMADKRKDPEYRRMLSERSLGYYHKNKGKKNETAKTDDNVG